MLGCAGAGRIGKEQDVSLLQANGIESGKGRSESIPRTGFVQNVGWETGYMELRSIRVKSGAIRPQRSNKRVAWGHAREIRLPSGESAENRFSLNSAHDDHAGSLEPGS